jgi:D-glycero-alpha-D-manno-heptose-7-phosphate kinase
MIISRAPVRISFFGGGTDYPEYFCKEGGAVLATAIDKFSYVTVSPFLSHLFDYSMRVSYSKVELAKNVSDIEHSVFRECLKLFRLEKDIEIHNVADLPAFTGLGSSSTFTVSLIHALHCFKGEFVRPIDLAYEAIHVERNLLKDNVGCQDQVTAALGGFNLIEFKTEEDIRVHRLPISQRRMTEFEQHLFVVFTGITRKAAKLVVKQLERISANTGTLKQMRGMVDQGWEILVGERPLSTFGSLLNQAWEAKRSLEGGISCTEIDKMYEMGRRAGAWGGKLLGAGGGGFILFFAPPESHANLKKTFADHQVLSVKINSPGSEIIFA